MITETACDSRSLREEEIESDLVIVGGGLAGACGAITAAREGMKVVLVQDRPVLGGNASSEVRLWILGATSHLGNNNRWSREGGVMNEIMEENLYRNRQGNALIFDTILLEKVIEEKNVTLLLNTAAYDVEKSDPDTISAVRAFCSQNSTQYRLTAPLFCDASGDGIVGFLAGAAFRMGAETKEEFNEGFAPDKSYGELLGHSMYFYSKDVGTPVKFTPPSWALKDITKIPRYRQFSSNMQGCNFWWLEYGGRLDTIHATEDIKWELWKVVYGVWNYIKNSGKFPEADTMTLEWVGHIPGKRESRRFEGDYMIHQRDVVEQTHFDDVVAHGGWSVDLHPADGVYAEGAGCNQWHSKGVYGIPYRCYYSKNINNLFLAGRIISATHVAFGTTRVMATCAAGAQAVAVAAALCKERSLQPRDIMDAKHLGDLQVRLDRIGQFLPGKTIVDPDDQTATAAISASSTLSLAEIPANQDWMSLDHGWAMLLPLNTGACPRFTFELNAQQAGSLRVELLRSQKKGNFTPDELVETIVVPFEEGVGNITAQFQSHIDTAGYYFIKLCESPGAEVRLSGDRLTGVLAVTNAYNKAVATSSLQSPPEGIGIDSFEFWLPKRRPEGCNLAMGIEPAIELFSPDNVSSYPSRPTELTNAWIASPKDPAPELQLQWQDPIEISQVTLEFDPDWDHPMESVLMTHPEEVVPFMVKDFDLLTDDDQVLAEVRDHHGARYSLSLNEALKVQSLKVKIHATHGAPAAIFRVRVL
ncbi:FAD-dependent oxidoreductase [Verrucomicrobiaceae bacterium 5K15]|uniref:FAD-dependent oxidoreductase n=1 Tax=Oceaniferula flava TaxID=2800421 RepID=A0AAE2VET5_9BACT|nr:FAD-dependent oxidoreductase [Oceaniferula flavus]MBK1856229.1 FAD-dependent oxidoreductase [Oceaniferula flavus]MBM1137536.1 FAD-dependent oxidoreductase [Oceaniferula flavus]